MTLRCEACGEAGIEPDARFCIACGGRLAEVDDPEPPPSPPPAPEFGASAAPAAAEPPESIPQPAPPRPVRDEEVPLALVVAGVVALLLVLLGLLLLT